MKIPNNAKLLWPTVYSSIADEAEASPAADWRPTSILPSEGRVVELRDTVYAASNVCRGHFRSGTLFVGDADRKPENFFRSATPRNYEWRYTPGERAEATINASAQSIAQQGRGNKPSDLKSDETPKAGSTPAGRAAPQRQNLACSCKWWDGNITWHATCRECGKVHNAPKKPLPPLHRVTVERERIRFLLVYKGRIPMTPSAKVPLAFPESAWRRR